MNPRALASLLLALVFFQAAPCASGAAKKILVYYMTWFTARPYGETWGWHWTMDRFNPEHINAVGQREIASWYYPLIGPYDSSDPAVLEYHVLLMKLAGIDGVMVDWYGSTDYLDYGINNKAAAKLFDFTTKANLNFAICYEDQTVKHLIDDGYLNPSKAIAHAQQDMLYLQTNWFCMPGYLHLSGKPVLLDFGPQYFLSNTNWLDIFSVLPESNPPAFFNEDNRLPASIGAFSWPPMWMSQAPGTGGILSEAALKSYLGDFDRKAANWPAFISSAFPRFHEIYQRDGAESYLGYLGDHHGDTFRETLSRAMTNSSAFVQIVTWNDFGEGSMVEPTAEYGYRDLAIIQDYRRRYLDPSFPWQTNDLGMALKFYRLRTASTNHDLSVKLDGIFHDIVDGKAEAARSELSKLNP